MSEEERKTKSGKGISITSIMPYSIARRIAFLTSTTSFFDSYRILCSQGYVELASLLAYYLAIHGEHPSAFSVYPLTDKLESCSYRESGSTLYMVFNIARGDMKDIVCLAVENFHDPGRYYVRPCTGNEYREIMIGTEEKRHISVFIPTV